MEPRSGWCALAGAVGLLIVAAAPNAHAIEYVNDPLTSSSHPGRGSKGGSYSASGWTTKGTTDSVWYEVDEALPTGSVQLTVTGLSLASTLGGQDHDILVVYQAPEGHAEPIAYSPYFRNNDFKAFLRIFGKQETDRPGAMKLELAFCPLGSPWYHDGTCPTECKQGKIAYANGQAKDIGWTATTAYTLRLEWEPGEMRFLRNGKLLGDVSFAGTYAPKPLRVRIGSPRHGSSSLAYMPAPVTFRDVVITGTPGTMTPVCEPEPEQPDAGSSPDAGASDCDAGLDHELPVLADVTAASGVSGVFADVTDLNVSGKDDGSPEAIAYLRFAPIAGSVKSAILRVRAQDYSSAAGGSGVICRVLADGWDEATLTWQNRPAIDQSACAGASVSVEPDNDVEWDVTSLISPGQSVNLAIVSADPNGTHFLSKEGSATLGPRLLVTEGCPLESDAGSSGGSGGGWTDGAPGQGGGAGTAPARGSTSEDAGCACGVPGSGRRSIHWISIAALAAACALRSRRRGR